MSVLVIYINTTYIHLSTLYLFKDYINHTNLIWISTNPSWWFLSLDSSLNIVNLIKTIAYFCVHVLILVQTKLMYRIAIVSCLWGLCLRIKTNKCANVNSINVCNFTIEIAACSNQIREDSLNLFVYVPYIYAHLALCNNLHVERSREREYPIHSERVRAPGSQERESRDDGCSYCCYVKTYADS